MTCIKTDPVLLEEQDDLLMSYLNSDYLSNDSSWPLDTSPSTPESTSSSEPAQLLSPSSPRSNQKEFFEVSHNEPVHWPMQPYFIHGTVQNCLQPDLLNGFPFIMPCVDGAHPPSSSSLPMAQPIYNLATPQPPSPSTSLSDFEQTKKRRGRKKRDSSASTSTLPNSNNNSNNNNSNTGAIASATVTNTTNIAPAPVQSLKSLAPLRPATTVETPIIKAEPIQITPSKATTTMPTVTNNTAIVTNTKPIESKQIEREPSTTVIDQKAAAIAKRQERLIKNRAAALLSRKRKREHLTALEEQKESLTTENDNLKSRVQDLETENHQLINENQELKKKLAFYESKPTTTTTTTTTAAAVTTTSKSKVSQSGMVLMIILFSFAILALPTAKNNKLPLMSSHTNVNGPTFQLNRYCDQTNNEDEVMEEDETFFIKSVSGSELEQNISTTTTESEMSPVRLYSDQLVQLYKNKEEVQQEEKNTSSSRSFSLLCPYKKKETISAASSSNEKKGDDQQQQRLLQIDMQVVGSRIVQGVFNIMEGINPTSRNNILERSQMTKRMRRRLAKARVKQRLVKRLA